MEAMKDGTHLSSVVFALLGALLVSRAALLADPQRLSNLIVDLV